MADYFRFYCDALDEPRFQYALHRESAVLPVWVWILCEHTRTHSDIVQKPTSATLLGLAHKLAQPIGKINEALKLLVEIEYLEDTGDSYKTRKWMDLQSQYLQRRVRTGKIKSVECTNTVRSMRQIDHLEERRGEERREDSEFIDGPGAQESELEASPSLDPPKKVPELASAPPRPDLPPCGGRGTSSPLIASALAAQKAVGPKAKPPTWVNRAAEIWSKHLGIPRYPELGKQLKPCWEQYGDRMFPALEAYCATVSTMNNSPSPAQFAKSIVRYINGNHSGNGGSPADQRRAEERKGDMDREPIKGKILKF